MEDGEKHVKKKTARSTKTMLTEWNQIASFPRTFPKMLVGLVLMATVSALNQSQPLSEDNVVYDTASDWSSCCHVDFMGPSKIPGVDFLTYQVNDCEEGREEESEMLLSPLLSKSLPFLSKIQMCTSVDGEFNLDFLLSLPMEDIIQGRLTDVQVTFGAMPGGGSNPRYFRPLCRQFSFAVNDSLLSATTKLQNVEIPNSCLARNLDEGTFTFQIRLLPWLQNIDYQITWAYFYDYSEVGIWNQLVVGVAPIPAAGQIAVVFQPPKAEELLDGLQLELFTFPEKLVNSTVISPSQTNFIFHHVTWGRYWVKVTPLSSLCRIDLDACTSVSSPEVLMIGQSDVQPAKRPQNVAILMDEKETRNEDGYTGLGRKLGIAVLAGAVIVLLVLATVLLAFVTWLVNRRRQHRHIPTLHMISTTLSPLEMKAVHHLALALSHGLGISVTVAWRDLPSQSQSHNDQLVLMVHPDSDSTDCQEKEERSSPFSQNVSNRDILALVAFSRSQDFPSVTRDHYSDDFSQNPSLLNMVASISLKSYQKIVFILFTEESQPVLPKLYFSVSEESGRTDWGESENDSDYQLTVPLRPSKSRTKSDALSTCRAQQFCLERLLSSCNTFYVPGSTHQLYSHLKSRVYKLNPGHKFPPTDDILNNEKWIAAHTVAQSVLRGQSLFYKDAASSLPGMCVTIDAVSLCSLKDADNKSKRTLSKHGDHRLASNSHTEEFHILPPRDILGNDERFDFNTDCDSFSNFSEMRRDFFS